MPVYFIVTQISPTFIPGFGTVNVETIVVIEETTADQISEMLTRHSETLNMGTMYGAYRRWSFFSRQLDGGPIQQFLNRTEPLKESN